MVRNLLLVFPLEDDKWKLHCLCLINEDEKGQSRDFSCEQPPIQFPMLV